MDKTSWPAWYYGPNNQAEIFQNADEVPEGWADHPSKVGGAAEEPEGEEDEEGEDELTAEAVADAFKQDELTAMIDSANKEREEDDQIEYAGNWAKVKLAQALLDAGVEIEMPEAEEE